MYSKVKLTKLIPRMDLEEEELLILSDYSDTFLECSMSISACFSTDGHSSSSAVAEGSEPLDSTNRDPKDDEIPASSSNEHPIDELALSDDSDADTHYVPVHDYSSPSSSDDNLLLHGKRNNERTETKRKGRSRVQRAEAKKLRNCGKTYMTEKGKIIPERKLVPLKACRMKCAERVKQEDREICFKSYWDLGSRNKRASYLSSLITINNKKTQKTTDVKRHRSCSCSYAIIIKKEKVSVCRSCFQSIFGETKGFVQILLQKKNDSPAGIVANDSRGLVPSTNKTTPEQLNEVKSHILSFPSYESHYCRNRTNKKFLSPNLSISRMYALYKENRDNPVCLTTYSNCFHDLGLAFKQPKQDTCHKCDLYDAKIKVASDEEKILLLTDRDTHHDMAKLAYERKKQDKLIAREDRTKAAFTFDLQQCLPTPYLTTSVSFYKRQLWSFNLTIHNLATDKATCYMWDETIALRGANEIASCLYHFILNMGDEIEEITFYSDTCGGQNKNNIVAFMFLHAIAQKPNLKKINHKFLVSGHTHMECDSDHSVIERAKKKSNMKINHLNDWIQLVRSAKVKNPFNVVSMKREDFLNFSLLGKHNGPYVFKKKDNNGDKFLWKPLQWLQYGLQGGLISFKHTLNEADDFKAINFGRRGRPSLVSLQSISNDQLPIPMEKKKDIISMLPLIDQIFHEFYINLKTKDDPPNDPDLDEWNPDENEEFLNN